MLTEERRPKKLNELLGQPKAYKFLTGWLKEYKTKGTADAFLIHGPSGSGKTSIAHAMCGELDCDWGVRFVASRECTIDAVREIAEEMTHSMLNGEKWRVVICDEAHLMSEPAKNAWLSLLERIPNYRLVIFTTTEPLSFDLVWRSRCKMIAVAPLDDSNIATALEDAARVTKRQVPESVRNQIASTCAGNLRAAYHELEKHMLSVTAEEDDNTRATEVLVPALVKATAQAFVNGGRIAVLPTAPQDALQDTKYRKTVLAAMQDGGVPKSEIERCAAANAEQAATDAEVAFEVRQGSKDGYIEILFFKKPDESIRARLKRANYRWSPKNRVWYGKSLDLPLYKAGHIYRDGYEMKPEANAVSVAEPEVIDTVAISENIAKIMGDKPLEKRPEDGWKPVVIDCIVSPELRAREKKEREELPIEKIGMIRKAPCGLKCFDQKVVTVGGDEHVEWILVHEGSMQSIGFPPFKDYMDCLKMQQQVYELDLCDWTKDCDELMAMEGVAEGLVTLLPEEDEVEVVPQPEQEPEPVEVAPVLGSVEHSFGWKVWVQTAGNGDKWSTNAMVYKTEEEAKEAGDSLMMRWMAVTAMEVRKNKEVTVDAKALTPEPEVEVETETEAIEQAMSAPSPKIIQMPSRREQLLARAAAIRARR